ncbi:ribose-5-phosphate isomerase A [Ascoidea rubescens DSM 1968]|uniref:Ribose-5-phosphate isomerase n=1 Tax=Ascoidea rubescens DSM 1968 TaxID=1344418 RepID=A0A1D2VGJ4_9ASCO|nr:ribose 5-phosphate isomerase [Ascoidea rubescens DSM 1968]ODV60756.1 ribose 5-phosphate isomerase [Ascoidea rubescens DSM 1968]
MTIPSELKPLGDPLEQAKRAAAYKAVDENISLNYKYVGIGSGSTVVYIVERLSQLPLSKNFIYVPTSFQSKKLILDSGLRLSNVDDINIDSDHVLDITFDGADEVDTSLNCIKGGGACLFQEKLIASLSKNFIIVADYRKKSPSYLGVNWLKGIPIEVVPMAWSKIRNDLLNKFSANKVTLRQGGVNKAGPVVTDNGNFILDVEFGILDVDSFDLLKFNQQIKNLVGVVETGLFISMAKKAYFGHGDGSVSSISSTNLLRKKKLY